MEFSWMEMMSSITFLSSFFTIVLKSTVWHHLELARTDNLSFGQRFKAVPFFLCAILMKCFVTGTVMSYLVNVGYPYLAITMVLTLLIYQCVIQKTFGFTIKEVVYGSIANLTSLARPNTDTGLIHTLVCKSFFKFETLTSTIIYFLICCSAIITKTKNDDIEAMSLYICLGLVGLHLLVTQVYLHTSAGLRALFPELAVPHTGPFQIQAPENTAVLKQPASREKNPKKRYRLIGWLLVIVSLAAILGLFAVISIQIFHTGN